ncbi:unnamed protein product, partial [Discosporangium mesarthrocarpum]
RVSEAYKRLTDSTYLEDEADDAHEDDVMSEEEMFCVFNEAVGRGLVRMMMRSHRTMGSSIPSIFSRPPYMDFVHKVLHEAGLGFEAAGPGPGASGLSPGPCPRAGAGDMAGSGAGAWTGGKGSHDIPWMGSSAFESNGLGMAYDEALAAVLAGPAEGEQEVLVDDDLSEGNDSEGGTDFEGEGRGIPGWEPRGLSQEVQEGVFDSMTTTMMAAMLDPAAAAAGDIPALVEALLLEEELDEGGAFSFVDMQQYMPKVGGEAAVGLGQGAWEDSPTDRYTSLVPPGGQVAAGVRQAWKPSRGAGVHSQHGNSSSSGGDDNGEAGDRTGDPSGAPATLAMDSDGDLSSDDEEDRLYRGEGATGAGCGYADGGLGGAGGYFCSDYYCPGGREGSHRGSGVVHDADDLEDQMWTLMAAGGWG